MNTTTPPVLATRQRPRPNPRPNRRAVQIAEGDARGEGGAERGAGPDARAGGEPHAPRQDAAQTEGRQGE
eukprot:1176754-Prorocentrum_minimum.AAC.4